MRVRTTGWVFGGALALLAGAAALRAAEPVAAPVDFARDIRPILTARCVACHGERLRQGGLRLHRKADALAGGDHGPLFVPGKSAESRLIRLVTEAEKGKVMPPTGERLTAAQIALLRAWIDQGAAWPDDGPGRRAVSTHWAFQPVRRPALPVVRQKQWVRNPVDAFILQALEKKGLRPSPEADRVTLIRRLSFDLLGLPPEPAEVDRFVADARPDAYEQLVDRLLASPHYGERQARFWLDGARYADSNGYTIDSRRSIWMYRDWVVRAFNEDLPFDQFTIRQYAADLLPDAKPEDIVATGFHRNTLVNEEGGTDPEQFRVEAVVDRVNTTGAVFLGLTLGCAQCHTHKYDPVTQREYYQLYAFLNDQDEPTLPFPTPEQAATQQRLRRDLTAARRALADYDRRHPEAEKAKDPERTKLAARVADLQKQDRELTADIPSTLVLRERPAPRDSFVQIRGDFLRPGVRVEPDVPEVLPPLRKSGARANRLDLARWLVDPANPLTPRVTMNRLWQQHFGIGLVETENDFGLQGTPPTHPELLDYLASEFVAGGWSVKAMHRLLVTSATYRQSSRFRPDLQAADPNNRLLGRQARFRIEAEIIRDAALAASGLLTRKVGGPSVYPPQPGGLDAFTQNKKNWVASTGEERFRRGLYTFFWRSSPYPLFAAFDAPNGNVTCTRRARSNTPIGALMLANDASIVEMAQALAARALREGGLTDGERLTWMLRRCLGRDGTQEEGRRLLAFLHTQLQAFEQDPAAAAQAAPRDRPPDVRVADAAAWAALARVLMNLDEFITRE